MASKLSKYEFTTRGRHDLYPWDQWMDGSIWQVERGSDFHSDPESFRTGLHQKASKHNMKVRTQVDSTSVVFQFYQNNGKPVSARKAPARKAIKKTARKRSLTK